MSSFKGFIDVNILLFLLLEGVLVFFATLCLTLVYVNFLLVVMRYLAFLEKRFTLTCFWFFKFERFFKYILLWFSNFKVLIKA